MLYGKRIRKTSDRKLAGYILMSWCASIFKTQIWYMYLTISIIRNHYFESLIGCFSYPSYKTDSHLCWLICYHEWT